MQCCHERQRYRRIFSAPEVSVIQATLVLVKELQAIECWFHSNLFIKTEVMLFGSSQKHGEKNQFSGTVNGSVIKRVTKFKYLGVICDEHLS